MSRQRWRSRTVPCTRRGYQASGAETSRPSVSSNVSVSSVTTARSAVETRRSAVKVFIPTVDQLLQRLYPHVLELHRHRLPRMDLEREDPALGRPGFVFIRHVRGLHPVDEVLQMVSFGDHHIVIPVVRLEALLDFLGFSK